VHISRERKETGGTRVEHALERTSKLQGAGLLPAPPFLTILGVRTVMEVGSHMALERSPSKFHPHLAA
jgi:hypothetical protein